MKPKVVFVTGLVVLMLAAAPGFAATTQFSTSLQNNPISTPPGQSVTVSYAVTNNGQNTTTGAVNIDNGSLPSSWSVEDVSGQDPNPQDSFAVLSRDMQVAFSDIDPGETVTASAQVSVPSDAKAGNVSLPFSFSSGRETVDQSNATITVTSPISFDENPTVTIEPGNSGNVTFSVSNTGSSTQSAVVRVDNSSLPANMSLSPIDGNDPNPVDQFAVLPNGQEVVFSDLDPSETVTVSATVSVPSNMSEGNYTMSAVVEDNSGTQLDTSTAHLHVKTITSPADKYDKNGNGVDTFEALNAVNDFRKGNLSIYDLLDVIKSLHAGH